MTRRFLFCLALLVSAAWAPLRAAPAATTALDFPDADIDAVSRAMAALLGRPIVVDARAKGKLTLYTDQPVTRAQ